MLQDDQFEKPQIRTTDDGSHTLYLPALDEHYHSHFGALTESMHIFINAGLASCRGDTISVLEVGFGTGLNALLSALYAEEKKIIVRYTSLDKYPLTRETLDLINHPAFTGPDGERIFRKIHNARWDAPDTISPWFTLEKKRMDLITGNPEGYYDLVFFDAFGPDKQPEMWSMEVMNKIAAVSHPGTVFVTYSAKGTLKRMLRALGYEVTLLPGPPGKRVMTRAVKK